MALTINDVREKYPQYNHFSDQELADKMHAKYYPKMPKEEFYSKVGYQPEGELTKIGHGMQDVAGAIMGQAQKAGGALLEGGEYVTRKLGENFGKAAGNPVEIPKWNAREFAGLEGDNKVDLQKIIAHDPNSLSSKIGEWLPQIVGGGTKLAGQALSSGISKLLTGEPGEKSLLGSATGHQGRVASAIEDMLTTGLAGKTFQAAPSLLSKIPNPTRLTNKAIAKDIVNTEKAMVEKYSGANGEYNKLSDEAKLRGINGDKISPNHNDLSVLQEHMPEDEYLAIDKLMKDKNLKNAQNAISQLGYRERQLVTKGKRDILNEAEKDLLKSVRNTKNDIQENMFKDTNGKIHQDLVDKHKEIQKGYATEVIPYTKNKAIQKFKEGKKLSAGLVKSLSGDQSEFAAMRGASHPELQMRRFISNHKTALGLGSTSLLGLPVYEYLRSR